MHKKLYKNHAIAKMAITWEDSVMMLCYTVKSTLYTVSEIRHFEIVESVKEQSWCT